MRKNTFRFAQRTLMYIVYECIYLSLVMLEVRQSSGSEAEEVGGVRGVAFDRNERRQFVNKGM